MEQNFSLDFNEAVNERVKKICEPLNTLGITTFTHTRCFQDGKAMRIASNLEWSKKFFENNFHIHSQGYQQNIKEASDEKNDLKIYVWNGIPENEIYSALQQYGIWNGITICENDEQSIGGWSFGSSMDTPNMVNFLLSNIKILKHFILYFKDTAHDILDTSDQRKLYQIPGFSLDCDVDNKMYSLIKEFFKKTKINRYYLKDNKNIYLSPREFECLFYLSTGKNMKQVAQVLNLSPRTVETYLVKIKNSYGVNYKNDLIHLFLDNIYKWL